MDVLSQLFSLLFRSLVVLLPLTTAWLALRRLVLSRSSNAWIYATTSLFAAATVAGILPWSLGIAQTSWIFFIFAAFCPAIWIGVIMLCDGPRISNYESDDLLAEMPDAATTFKSRQPIAPLVLENPDWPDEPVAVFRHRASAAPAPTVGQPQDPPRRSLVAIAREMRGNVNSEARRPKLLPPPELDELPFLVRS